VIATATPMAAFLIGVNYSSFLGAGPDSSGYVSQAHKWVNGDLRSPIPDWAIHGTFGGALWAGAPFGYKLAADRQSYVPVYSPGVPLIMSLFERAGGPDAVFYVVPLFGALLVWGAYLLGRQLADEWAGAIAAALMLVSPAFLWLLIEPMSDVPVAACWTMALVLASQADGPIEAFVSGVASGTAILMRPNVAPLAIFPALLLLLSGRRRLTDILLFGIPAVSAALVIATINARWYGSPFTSGYGSIDSLYSSDRIPRNLRQYVGWLSDTQTPIFFLWVAAPFVLKAYDGGRRFVLLLLYPLAVLAMYVAYLNFDEGDWGTLRFLLPAYPVILASLAATLVLFARHARHRMRAVAAVAVETARLEPKIENSEPGATGETKLAPFTIPPALTTGFEGKETFRIKAEKVPNSAGIRRVMKMLGGVSATLDEFVAAAKPELKNARAGWIVGGYLSNWIPQNQPAQFKKGFRVVQDILPTSLSESADVVLPAAAGWYDFWTGAAAAAGKTVDVPAPYDAIPIHVKAGSIVPTGPEIMYSDEKPADPIVLWVYAGADGQFTLYEDDGLTYGYEKGAFTRIPLRWNDATRTLTIGKREGGFPGMQKERSFEVVLVSKPKPVGFSFTPKADKTVRYDGTAVDVKL